MERAVLRARAHRLVGSCMVVARAMPRDDPRAADVTGEVLFTTHCRWARCDRQHILLVESERPLVAR